MSPLAENHVSADNLKGVCYQHSFLTQVILRVDFPAFLENLLTGSLSPIVSKSALTNFPIAEPQATVAREFQISEKEVTKKETPHTTWNFHGKNREKTLTITPNFFVVQRLKYSTYEELKAEFFEVLYAFLDVYSDAVISRFGLRFINEITLDDGAPTDWDGYLDPQLLSTLAFFPNRNELCRVFNIAELNFGDLQLKFQFGMHNPDYPATIKRKSFILDLDAYYVGLLDRKEIVSSVDRAHARIQELFERSITAKLREKMK